MTTTRSLTNPLRNLTRYTLKPKTQIRKLSQTPAAAMRAYWYDNKEGDQRLPHDSGRPATESDLASLGIKSFVYPNLSDVDALAKSRGYRNRDEVTISPQAMGDAYEGKVKMFFHEHLHEDEEIRYILDGGGYFDVRNKDDDWVRIELHKHDLMIMPAGIYHRFTTDQNNYTKAMRLFQDDPKWTPLNRGDDTDINPIRNHYLETRDAPRRAYSQSEASINTAAAVTSH